MIDPSIANLAGRKESDAAATLQVDVIADLICPWCYLGKRRLDSALAAVHGPSVVTWFPFQLNPGMPSEGMPFDDYLATKFGDPETVRPGLDYLTEAGRAEGIEFNFDKIKRVPRTLDAHQIMSLADGATCIRHIAAEQVCCELPFSLNELFLGLPVEQEANHDVAEQAVVEVLDDDTQLVGPD